jgi:predicted metal-dependent HD superfamily phosphohydrolase
VDIQINPAYDAQTKLHIRRPHAVTLISEPLRAELIAAYTAPDRHYHDLRHIETLLGLAKTCAGVIADDDAVEAAIWFHDAIYDSRRGDNEERSAALATERLAGAARSDRIDHIATMIRATAGHAMPDLADAASRHDCALFLDMDLSILGSPAADFDAYEAGVRREYDWVSDARWRLGRRAVLAGFLARPTIYASDRFQASHEAAARRNLTRAIARLDEQ